MQPTNIIYIFNNKEKTCGYSSQHACPVRPFPDCTVRWSGSRCHCFTSGTQSGNNGKKMAYIINSGVRLGVKVLYQITKILLKWELKPQPSVSLNGNNDWHKQPINKNGQFCKLSSAFKSVSCVNCPGLRVREWWV